MDPGREHVSLHGDFPRPHHQMRAMASSKFPLILIAQAMTSQKLFLMVTIIQFVLPNVKKMETALVILGMDAPQIGVIAGSKTLSKTVKPSMLANAAKAHASVVFSVILALLKKLVRFFNFNFSKNILKKFKK